MVSNLYTHYYTHRVFDLLAPTNYSDMHANRIHCDSKCPPHHHHRHTVIVMEPNEFIESIYVVLPAPLAHNLYSLCTAATLTFGYLSLCIYTFPSIHPFHSISLLCLHSHPFRCLAPPYFRYSVCTAKGQWVVSAHISMVNAKRIGLRKVAS